MIALMMKFLFFVLRLLMPLFSALLLPAANAAPAGIAFTPQEKAYLERVGTLRVCVDPDWIPFEHINAQGQHEGIAADLLQLVAQRVGLKIEVYPVNTWDESLAASQSKRCQLMSFLNQTPARDQWLIFTQPIFYDQNIIITREEHPYIGELRDLAEHTVVLPRGTMIEERIRLDFPNLKVITTDSEADAISYVSERKADMTVRSLIVAAYAIKKQGFFNLKISGHIPAYSNQLRIGVLKDEPLLRDILDKGVRSVTAEEREAIANRHVLINVQNGVDYTLVWQIAGAAACLLLLVLAGMHRLNALNRELARLSVTDKPTGLFNRVKMHEVLESEFQRSLRFGHPFSVILLEIGGDNEFNDGVASEADRQARLAVADVLKTHTRKTDVLGCVSGREFMLISTHTDQKGAIKLAESLRQRLADLEPLADLKKTIRIGVATNQLSDQVIDILVRAEAVLEETKR